MDGDLPRRGYVEAASYSERPARLACSYLRAIKPALEMLRNWAPGSAEPRSKTGSTGQILSKLAGRRPLFWGRDTEGSYYVPMPT